MPARSSEERLRTPRRPASEEEPWTPPGSPTLPSWESFPSGDRELLLQTLIQVARRQATPRHRPTPAGQGR